MPSKRYFSNREVALQAARNVQTLSQWSEVCQQKVVDNPQIKFDTRNLRDLAPLLFDLKDIPENDRKSYFETEYDRMIDAFNTPGQIPGKPDPEAIKPYIQRMFQKLVTNLDEVDFNNPDQVQNTLLTMKVTQCVATIIDDFPHEAMELFPTHEAMHRIDAFAAKTYMVFLEGRVAMSEEDLDEIAEYVEFIPGKFKSTQMKLQAQASNVLFDAAIAGKNEVIYDPTLSEEMAKFLMDESFTNIDEYGPEQARSEMEFTEKDFGNHLVNSITSYYANSSFEQMLIKVADGEETGFGGNFSKDELLVIGGRSVADIKKDLMDDKGLSAADAEEEVGRRLRYALTTGTSPVTLVTCSFDKDGKVQFHNIDIKVDLDKLNREERARNHNVFRRMLDTVGIWKIPAKYPTNEERDMMWKNEMDSHRSGVELAEDKLLYAYNAAKRPVGTHKGIVNSIPKASRAFTQEINRYVNADKAKADDRGPEAVMSFRKEQQNVPQEPVMTDLVNEGTVVNEPLNAETVVNEPVTEETVVNEQPKEETVVKEQPKEEAVVKEQPKEEEKKPVIREKSQNELKAEQRIADTKVKENIKAKFNAITANATMAPYFKDMKPSDRMKSMTKNVLFDVFYNHAAEYIGEMWEATGNKNPALLQKVMADKSNEMFYRAESALAQFGLSTEERFAAAQKMTDMMINRFSPVAFDKNLETFGDAYFLKHTSKDEIGTLAKTDDFSVQRRVWTIALNDIRDSKEQLDLSAEFEENEEIKAPKIEDRNELSKNRVKE